MKNCTATKLHFKNFVNLCRLYDSLLTPLTLLQRLIISFKTFRMLSNRMFINAREKKQVRSYPNVFIIDTKTCNKSCSFTNINLQSIYISIKRIRNNTILVHTKSGRLILNFPFLLYGTNPSNVKKVMHLPQIIKSSIIFTFLAHTHLPLKNYILYPKPFPHLFTHESRIDR